MLNDIKNNYTLRTKNRHENTKYHKENYCWHHYTLQTAWISTLCDI